MIDNFFEDNYHSYDKVYQHPETQKIIYLGDMQSAIDNDFLHNQKIKTGRIIAIKLSPQRGIWNISFLASILNTLSTHLLTEKAKISPIFSKSSTNSLRKDLKKAIFSYTALQASLESFSEYLELYFGHILCDEKIKIEL